MKGLYPDYAKIENQDMALRKIYQRRRRTRGTQSVRYRQTCLREPFNPGEDPCGKYVRVDGIYYQVIGMCVSEGNMNIQGRASEAVVLPFSTMQQAYNMGKRIDVICYTVKPGKGKRP